MNIDNQFEILVDILYSMSPQIGEIVPKSQYLVILFHLRER